MRWLKSLFSRKTDASADARVDARRPVAPESGSCEALSDDASTLDPVPAPVEVSPSLADEKHEAVPAEPVARRFADAEDEGRWYDMDQTDRLTELLLQPVERRDDAWFDAFYDAVWHAALSLPWDTPVEGPDGFPYLRFDLPPQGEFEPQCLGALAVQCVKQGFGAAIFAGADDSVEQAAFVFSMGRIDSILRFDQPEGGALTAMTPAGGEAGVRILEPTSAELSSDAARALLMHLEHGWGMESPRIGILHDSQNPAKNSLVVSVKRSELPDDAPLDEMIEMLGWYLPPESNIMFLPEDIDKSLLTPLENRLN